MYVQAASADAPHRQDRGGADDGAQAGDHIEHAVAASGAEHLDGFGGFSGCVWVWVVWRDSGSLLAWLLGCRGASTGGQLGTGVSGSGRRCDWALACSVRVRAASSIAVARRKAPGSVIAGSRTTSSRGRAVAGRRAGER